MNLFISWSGPISGKIGEILRRWFPSALHFTKPYFSPDDIEKGSRWDSEISRELDASDFGIICLTAENLARPWIMFEAGALAKHFDSSRVCPVLFGIDRVPTHEPLAQFQLTKFAKKDFKKLFKSINGLCGDLKLDQDVLNEVYEMWWPRLEKQVQSVLKLTSEKSTQSEPPTTDEMIKEILDLSRTNMDLIRRYTRNKSIYSPHASPYLRRTLTSLSQDIYALYQLASEEGANDILENVAHVAQRLQGLTEELEPTLEAARQRLQSAQMGPPKN